MPTYPGVDEDDEPEYEERSNQDPIKAKRDVLAGELKERNKRIEMEEDIQALEQENRLEAKRKKVYEKESKKWEREENKKLDKELKELEYEEKHPSRVKARKRLRSAEKTVRKQVGRAWRHTERVALDVAKYRKSNPPRVIPKPRGMRLAPAPTQRRSNMNQEEMVTSSAERNFFGSQQQTGQEKDFFGPPKIYDILGDSNTPKKEIDYIGNGKKKNNIRYY